MSKTLNRTQRRALLSQIPWVKKLIQGRRCEAIKWSHMSFKDAISEEGRERHRCRNIGYWKFRALKRSNNPAKDGIYCMSHLLHFCLYYNAEETKRTSNWYEKYQKEHQDLPGRPMAIVDGEDMPDDPKEEYDNTNL